MIIYVDIDNTICNTFGVDYENAIPIRNRIEKINELYKNNLEGAQNVIVYWTARGTGSGTNHFEMTYEQLKKWGCLFHELRMGKPIFDIFIDDKCFNSEEFFSK